MAEDKLMEEEIVEEELVKEVIVTEKKHTSFNKESWKPKTSLGMKVKSGEIDSLEYVLDNRLRILEHEIVDVLMPNLVIDLLFVGQSKGKFGGGQKRVFRQTQKKTQEGNKPHFGTVAVLGNGDGYIGIGYGKSKETVPAREKATRNAKQNIVKILRGCGSWQCGCKKPHSIPFAVEGRKGSVRIRLMPAPRGTGLSIEGECAKMLKIAGIKDIRSHTFGQTRTKVNLIYACFEALKKLSEIKIRDEDDEKLGIVEGAAGAQNER
ncbi:MAG: 30S ribosomal protein S5 [Nanoarchaeota archaeon]